MEILGYIAIGSLMKLTDEIAEVESMIKACKWISILLGMTYGTIMGLLISSSQTSVYVLGGITVGCIIAGKVDTRAHYFALASIFSVILILGFELANPLILLLVAFSSIIDEMANDRYSLVKNKALKLFFEHRMAMKVLLLTFSVHHILSYYSIIFLLTLDSSYYVTEKAFRRLTGWNTTLQ